MPASPHNAAPTIVWFRQDLRLADQPALQAALQRGGPVIPVYLWSPEEEGGWGPGGASRWWLHGSLSALAKSLARIGSRLILRRGPALATLRALARETGAGAVVWNRRYEPAVITRDAAVKQGLREDGLVAESFNGSLLIEPWSIKTGGGNPYQVFTPFWKQCSAILDPPDPLPSPTQLPAPAAWPESLALGDLGLLPRIDWAAGMREAWTPGEAGAQAAVQRFLDEALVGYPTDRDRPDRVGSSRLSPYLHTGELSPRQVWHAVSMHAAIDQRSGVMRAEASYLREIGWREFAHHLLYHFPQTPEAPLRPAFERFPWRDPATDPVAAADLRAWQRGRTGYPLVDAGMQELWHTGWMHNRVRMVVASFLVKNLLLDWRHGAAWFWDTLVDADLANNTLGWQWSAGCGADAAPYFRIFNPITQSEKCDPKGAYIRRWLPALGGLPDASLHAPWDASPLLLAAAGRAAGKGQAYPPPIVDHPTTRKRALDAYATVKSGG